MSQLSHRAGRRQEARTNSLIQLALSIALIVAALFLVWGAVERFALLLNYPFPHDGLEGTLLYEARLLRAGEPLYIPLELYRFKSAPYPPFHPYLLAVFDLISGPHVFWAGRLLSLLAAIGVALVAAFLIRQSGSAWPVAVLGAALMLTVPPLQLWGTRIKPDLLALFLTASGLYFAAMALRKEQGRGAVSAPKEQRPIEQENKRTREQGTLSRQANQPPSQERSPGHLIAAICFALGFFTKQTALAGPLAAGLALLVSDVRDWIAWRNSQEFGRAAFVFGLPLRWRTCGFSALYLVLTLGGWLMLDLVTAGQYTVHVWWGGRLDWWSFGLFSKIVALLQFWWPMMLLSAVAVIYSFRQRTLFVPACYMLVAPLTLLGAGETGSHHNHLLETHLALTIAGCSAVGMSLKHINAWLSASRIYLATFIKSAIVLLLAVQVVLALEPPEWYAGELEPQGTPERFLVFIQNTPGEILADDTGLLFQAGKDLRYDDPSTMGPAAATGKWDQRGLLEEISQKRFSAIMLPVNVERSAIDPAGRWTPEMLAAIKANYQLQFRDKIYTYVPRP